MTKNEVLFEIAANMIDKEATIEETTQYTKMLSDKDNAIFAKIIITLIHNRRYKNG